MDTELVPLGKFARDAIHVLMQYSYRMGNNGFVVWGRGRHEVLFYDVISLENLLAAWKEFRKGKRTKRDVAAFELRLEDNLFALHRELVSDVWKPDPYIPFYKEDPKLRLIHKASVRDRVLYQAVFRSLYTLFDEGFIHDSYSSRNGKGTHRGVKRFEVFARKVTANYRTQGFALKCDIRKFFDSIDHNILYTLLAKKIEDGELLALLRKIIGSFSVPHCATWIPASPPSLEVTDGRSAGMTKRGLPLGNITSQLFANVYLNELDQFAKRQLKARYYIRYCDDFVVLDDSKVKLDRHIFKLGMFLKEKLDLEMHPRKVEIRKLQQGVDFLGYVSLPHYSVLRTRTKRRMLARVAPKSLSSYLGVLSHCRGEKIKKQFEKLLHSVTVEP